MGFNWGDVAGDIINTGLGFISDNQNRKFQEGQANRAHDDMLTQMEMQKQFAQNGIRWKVEDAVAAGLHPLAALGATPSSYSPVSVISGGGPNTSSSGDAINRLSSLGQNIIRSQYSTASKNEKALTELNLRNAKLQGDALQAQIAESLARTAEINRGGSGKGRGVPDPYSDNSMGQGDIPPIHMLMRGPKGTKRMYSPDAALSVMADPFDMWLSSLENSMHNRYYRPVKQSGSDAVQMMKNAVGDLRHPWDTLRRRR